MRQLKFRHWCKISHTMEYYDGFPINNKEGTSQSTEMLDTEGIHIYEGDIVELRFAIGGTTVDIGCGRYLVSFYRTAFRLEEIEPNWWHPCYEEWLHDYNICKVIGNMWADAHLLLPNKPVKRGGPYELER